MLQHLTPLPSVGVSTCQASTIRTGLSRLMSFFLRSSWTRYRKSHRKWVVRGSLALEKRQSTSCFMTSSLMQLNKAAGKLGSDCRQRLNWPKKYRLAWAQFRKPYGCWQIRGSSCGGMGVARLLPTRLRHRRKSRIFNSSTATALQCCRSIPDCSLSIARRWRVLGKGFFPKAPIMFISPGFLM